MAVPDFGPHPGVRSEWWYFSGRLLDESNADYFYALIFFRSSFGIEINRFAQFLLSSGVTALGAAYEKRVSSFGTYARIGLKGLDIDYDGWTAAFDGRHFVIRAAHDCHEIELRLSPDEGLISGYERQIELGTIHRTCRSFPRLNTTGTIKLGQKTHGVRGLSWFDHDWGTLALSHHWDWWGINLENGSDLVINRAGGRGMASLCHPDGRMEMTTAIRTSPVRYWRNARGTLYPIAWRIEFPTFDMLLDITAEHDRCETPFRIRYWEGPCRVQVRQKSALIQGRGYMELVGYDSGMLRFVATRLTQLCRDLVWRNGSTTVAGPFPAE
jgi:predicted secreted hydrolase